MPLVLVLAGAVVGPGALGFLNVSVAASDVERITETTLALLLFADAATLDLGEVREDAGLPARLLLIGLPLTVFLGAAAAIGLFPGEGFGFALLIGSILAPTDAALGLPIFTDPRVPGRIRRALNIESGLNDGIATPLVTLFLALTLEEQHAAQGWLLGALSGIGWGLLVGVVGGLVGGRLFAVGRRAPVDDGHRPAGRQPGAGTRRLLVRTGGRWQRLHRRVRRRPCLRSRDAPPIARGHGVHRGGRNRPVDVRLDHLRRDVGRAAAASISMPAPSSSPSWP